MKIKRIEHIGINVDNLQASRWLWEDCFGIPLSETYRSARLPVEIAMYPIGESMVEVIVDTTLNKQLANLSTERKGGRLIHICFEVENIDEALAELKAKGIGVMERYKEGPRLGHGGCRVAFLDPAATDNCFIELAELPKP